MTPSRWSIPAACIKQAEGWQAAGLCFAAGTAWISNLQDGTMAVLGFAIESPHASDTVSRKMTAAAARQ